MPLPVIKDTSVIDKIKVAESIKRWTLNFTDIVANNNKYYNLEVVKTDKDKFFLFSQYGRVGATGAQEYRACNDQQHAESEGAKIIKSKLKKGYVEVKLSKADVGSEIGKTKVENKVSVEALQKAGVKVQEEADASKLHIEVQNLVRTWFGITQEFVELNLDLAKCPLGQLSLDQIDLAKKILGEARTIIHAKKPDIQELNKLTNQYYSNIPHNFGHRKLDADVLRLDEDTKIDKALSLLEVFENTKDFSTVLTKKSAIDEQYKTLNAEIDYLDPSTTEWKWLDLLLHSTRAHNHQFLGKIKLNRAFKLKRNDEEKLFLSLVEEIAKKSHKPIVPPLLTKIWDKRIVEANLADPYSAANVLPLFHGTRTANMIGITSKGLLVKHDKVGASGSMYGVNALYFGFSSKSLNYTSAKGSYWSSGSDKYGYMFITDVALGQPKIAEGAYNYSWKGLQPNYHSVWAQGGKSGVINDEFMTYRTGQNCLRYILEVECQAK
jgi:poly [ADP-ribose] polymerase 2/3/4